MEHLFPVIPLLHLRPSGGDEASWWLLGIAAGFALAIATGKVIRSRI